MRRSVVLLAMALLAACSEGDDAGRATTATTEPRPSGYVALGDSFSSGEGAEPYDAASGRCHRSPLSWPHLADDLGDLLEVRACSGARLEHLLGPWTDRGQPPQIPAAADDRVGLVTFTIGGNDAGFGDIVLDCVLTNCGDVPGSDDFEATLDAIGARLTDEVYPALRAAYPKALLVHVGYPSLTPAEGRPVRRCPWLSPAEQTAVPRIVRELDDMARAAVDARDDDGLAFVSVFDALAGHELCADASWVHQVLSFDSARAHPTAAGYRAIAEAVEREVANLDA
jgi:lysophospholipase L1-like esterase